MPNPSQPTPVTKRNWLIVFRISIAAIVLLALVYTVYSAASQLSKSEFSILQIQYGWVALAVVVYVGAMFLSAVFWHLVLCSLGQQPDFRQSMLAFFASQLGKYVPGKAMVVVIRTDMIRSETVKTAPAIASVFVETLTWIFVGSAIASLLLVFQFREQVALVATAIVMTLVAGLLTWPSIFRWVANRLLQKKLGGGSDMFRGLGFPVMARGWLLLTAGWLLNGLSFWLVLKSIPGVEPIGSDLWLALACVSLATVAGFVSLMPGGLGVRELVIIPLIGAQFGSVTAIVAAVMIRLVWLGAELLTSVIIYFSNKRSNVGSSRQP